MTNYKSKSWHQQKGETAKQFQMFEFFLSLQPDLQSYQTVRKQFSLSREYVERIAKKNKWIERSRNCKRHFQSLQDEIKAKAAQKIAFDWADWELENLEKVRVATEQMLTKCQKMLNAPLTEQTEKQKVVIDKATGVKITDSQGNVVYQNIIIIKPIRFNASDVLKYAEAVLILTKYLVEQNRITIPVNRVLPQPSKPIAEMTEDERQAYIDDLRSRQQAISRGEKFVEFDDDGEL